MIAGVAAMFCWPLQSMTERFPLWVAATLFGALALAHIPPAAIDALVVGAVLAMAVIVAVISVRRSSETDAWPPSGNNSATLFISLALLCISILGFFSLPQRGVSITTRQFVLLMPGLAIVGGVGVTAVVQAIAWYSRAAPFGVVATLVAASAALALPGSQRSACRVAGGVPAGWTGLPYADRAHGGPEVAPVEHRRFRNRGDPGYTYAEYADQGKRIPGAFRPIRTSAR